MLERKITIGICDDNAAALDNLEKIITEYLYTTKEEGELLLFQSGENLLPHIESLDILFLDIEMPGMDGIEAGRHVAEKNPDCKIIMATSHFERIKEAFEIRAFRFVSKPFSKEEVENALTDALNLQIGKDGLVCYHNRMPFEIRQRDILFAYAYESYVEIVTRAGKFRKDVSMEKLLDMVDQRMFCRVNRTYIINMHHVKDYKKNVFYIGGQEIRVARRKKNDFEHRFREFDIKYRR